MSAIHDIFENIPAFPFPEEITQNLLEKENIRIERIVSAGHVSPINFWYDQPDNEWVVLLSGSAVIRFRDPDNTHNLSPGNFLYIPAHQLHRVEKTSTAENTLWLAIFFP